MIEVKDVSSRLDVNFLEAVEIYISIILLGDGCKGRYNNTKQLKKSYVFVLYYYVEAISVSVNVIVIL